MKKTIVFGILLSGLILLYGCTAAQEVGGELGDCMNKCSEMCETLHENNFDFGGYQSIGLSKQDGAVSISCNCLCSE